MRDISLPTSWAGRAEGPGVPPACPHITAAPLRPRGGRAGAPVSGVRHQGLALVQGGLPQAPGEAAQRVGDPGSESSHAQRLCSARRSFQSASVLSGTQRHALSPSSASALFLPPYVGRVQATTLASAELLLRTTCTCGIFLLGFWGEYKGVSEEKGGAGQENIFCILSW